MAVNHTFVNFFRIWNHDKRIRSDFSFRRISFLLQPVHDCEMEDSN